MPEQGGGPVVAWFHCFSGIAGDMALGALVDAGADVDEVRTMLKRLSVEGWAIEAEPVLRSGIAGTKVHVQTEVDPPARTAAGVAVDKAAAAADQYRASASAASFSLRNASIHSHTRRGLVSASAARSSGDFESTALASRCSWAASMRSGAGSDPKSRSRQPAW